MTAFVLPLLIGIVAGLRAMTAPAAVSWAARLGWLEPPMGLLGVLLSVAWLVVEMHRAISVPASADH